jgi:predicted ATPase/DNA-binding winged helix-turn-helix (wHTH) protein
MPSSPVYLFAPFRLVPDQRLLTASDSPLKLGGRAFETLVALIERRDRTVSKYELLELVWPNLIVEEANLQVQIGTLRKLLGHQAIATVPGRGYRFTMPVVVEGTATAGPAAGAAPGPAPATPGGPRLTNIPEQIGLLYGRDADIAGVRGVLEAHPLVTIAGAGGIGKTRLAQAVAHAAQADFPEGVWWIDLAALSNDELVASTVARALGVQVTNERDATAAVLAVIGQRKMLLVIDNCEHLLDGVTAFAEAATAISRTCLLVTSQEVLRTRAEYVYRLGTLAVPLATELAAILDSGAGALFVARARAADPRFVLNSGNLEAVVEICRRLDGIPLAIELAAARMPLLGAEGVRSRLSERFNLLTAGARVVLRRHQTLRAALEWSHSLLDETEMAVFRRLGIFAGGFTLESAQRVADDDSIDAWDVLEHLGALVDKSLVLAEGDSVPRYRMLETTRLFALEQLADAGETEALKRRHAQAMLAMLRVYGAPPKRYRTTPLDWASISVEIDNVRVALDYVQQLPALDIEGLELVSASLLCFIFAHAQGEGLTRLRSFRSMVTADLPAALRGGYWLALAQAGVVAGSPDSLGAARQASELFEQLGDDERRYAALVWIIATSARLREVEDVTTLIAAAARLESTAWPPRLRSQFQWAQHRWLLRQGRPEEALGCANRQVELIAESGAPNVARMVEGANVVYCEMMAGRIDYAERRSREILGLTTVAGHDAGHVLDTLMLILIEQGRFEEAELTGRRALEDLRRGGDEFRLLESLALVAAETGRLHDAARVAGYVDHVMAGSGEVRWPLTLKHRARLDDLLSALPVAETARLRAEGAGTSMEGAFDHALSAVEHDQGS